MRRLPLFVGVRKRRARDRMGARPRAPGRPQRWESPGIREQRRRGGM
jgi:hypothetical protein